MSTYKSLHHMYKRFRKAKRQVDSDISTFNIQNRAAVMDMQKENAALKREGEKLRVEGEGLKARIESLESQVKELNGAMSYVLGVKSEELKGDRLWYQPLEGQWKKWKGME
ncbi:hypothetical protein QC762_600554 [Podospora pseudocomata]|uniref:Uncharacterized protein n=1 Tax=Podospora pseudocomata TaxID=2093779 RepID=A0ABR0G7P2_9PEZI|nr:hypothetical protein QC762_600554 [Podospora pseudocomata]